MPQRLCGTRIAGGVYIECGLSPYGQPVEYFLIDPPQPVSKDDIGLSSIGVKSLQINGVWHVIDWVGAQHYPSPKDFIDEVRKLGLSRRIPNNFPFHRLTRESRIYLVHPKADILNHAALYAALEQDGWTCPKDLQEHAGVPQQACIGLHWAAEPDQLRTAAAFFAVFPITNLAVIEDPAGNKHVKAQERASQSALDVYIEQE